MSVESFSLRQRSNLRDGAVAFLVMLFDEATETVINGVDQQDRLAEVAADGSFTLKLNGEDNVIVDLAGVGSGQVEKYVIAMYWFWNDVSRDRSGIQLVRFRGHQVGVQVFPAMPWPLSPCRLPLRMPVLISTCTTQDKCLGG